MNVYITYKAEKTIHALGMSSVSLGKDSFIK